MKASERKSARYWCALTVLTISCGLTACDSMDRAESVRSMNSGLEALELGRTMDAVRSLKEAAQIDPTYAEPPYYLGQIYHMKLTELDNAEHHYREALERDKENPQIAYRLGTVLADQKEWGESEGFFRQAVNNDAEFAKAWFRMGISQEMQGNYADAVESYMSSIKANARMLMDDEDPGGAAYHALGDIYIRYGFYDKALQVYENGILNNDLDSRPKKPARLYQGRGVAQLKAGKFQDAEGSFRKALELEPTMHTAIFNLAVAQMAMGQTEAAVKGFEMFTMRADPAADEARIIAAQGFIQQINVKKEQQEQKE